MNNKETLAVPAYFNRLTFTTIFLLWVLVMFGFGYLYYTLDQNSPVLTTLTGDTPTLADSLYFSFVTATTIGYGDIIPVSYGRLLVVIEILLSLLLYGVVISKLTHF